MRGWFKDYGREPVIQLFKKYGKKDFDFLFVFTERREKYLIPWTDLDNRNEISIETKKYKKYLF